ncbi:MAG: tRNA pseudouridine(55) synthase TruB [Planctomycetes bacterium]|nr:tRNA pseudouridine(55) synthase TruB [Planctomycetota bacterium]
MSKRWFGLLNVNKPGRLSSRQVVSEVARLVRPAKAGHAGTLDPLATGVLVVCVGRATRLISHVQRQRKEYRAQFLLGKQSDTDDITGRVTDVACAATVCRSDVEALLPRFIGRVEQVPPQFSAVHVNGQRAYKLARRGETVNLQPRTVEIHRIEILGFDFPRLELEIECGSGTYVRSIGRDLGNLLGCGGVMSELVRTRIGPFHLSDAVPLDELTSDTLAMHVRPATDAVADLPRYLCNREEETEFRHGRSIVCRSQQSFPETDCVALIACDGVLAGLARYDRETATLSPQSVFLQNE